MKILKKVLVIVALLFTSVLSFWRPLKKVNAASGGSQGETWVINEKPNMVLNGSWISFTAPSGVMLFTSNNKNYKKLASENDYPYPLYYYYPDALGNLKTEKVYLGNGSWANEAYRTVTFNTAPTGDLLTWLQSNAVKVVEEIPVESIEIDPPGAKMLLGSTRRIFAIVFPQNTTDEVTYYSNNEAVVTVSEDGLVTAVGLGTATITASAGDKSDTVVFTVVEDTYSVGYYDGYDEGYSEGYSEGYYAGMNEAADLIFENGIEDFTAGTLKQVNSYDYLAGYQYGDYYQGMTDVFWKGLPTDHPLHGQYALSWWYNHNVYYEGEYYDNPFFYEIITSTDEYHNAYSQGKADAMAENPESVGFFSTLFGSIGSFLSIEILPNISFGLILAVPLIFGIISFLIGKGK